MPDRTCIVCRTKGSTNIFFRMVISPVGDVVSELGRKLPGRGAHCCFNMKCISKLGSSNCLEVALKRGNFRFDTGELVQNVMMLLRQNLEGMLVASKRKGRLTYGKEAVFKKIRLSKMGKPFVSKDISPRSLMNLKHVSKEFYTLPFTMYELGELLSRKPVGVLFIDEPLFVNSICLRLMQGHAISNV
ncbi:MAG: DUF448 domain-containing protein [Nitrospinae bacterium]|nr:DUF448 domain-containing protein [Nitrospinota bacterium]